MVELEDFKYGGTNITAFRLVDPNDELVQVLMAKLMTKVFVNLKKKINDELVQLVMTRTKIEVLAF